MSSNHVLFTLSAVLFSYRAARTRPRRITLGTSVLVRAALQTVLIAPAVASGADWRYVAAMIGAIGVSDLVIGALAEARPRKNEYAPETVGLFARTALTLFFAGNPRFIPGFNDLSRGFASLLGANSVIAASITEKGFHDLLLTVSGVLLAGFDINSLVAMILKRSHLLPPDGRVDADSSKEAGRGRIIGILERSIVFVLVVRGNFSAVGITLAAKAIARFKDLDRRDFAEYVLIGTLLSISLAIAVAFFLQSI